MIKVTFTDEIEIITSTEHLYQWDVGQVLEIEGLTNIDTPIIHFGVKGDVTGYAVQSQLVGGKLVCGIPDTTLQSGKQIIAYIYVSAGVSKNTEKVILIPVVERNKPSNYKTVNMDDITETQLFFDSVIKRVETLENDIANVDIKIAQGVEQVNNRIDNIINHNNDTNGNTELIDIRVGADGTVYASAGEAVRSQVSALLDSSSDTELRTELEEAIGVVTVEVEKIDFDIYADYYYSVNPTEYADGDGKISRSGARFTYPMQVTEGQKFFVSGVCRFDTALIAEFDENQNFINGVGKDIINADGGIAIDYEYTVPSGVAYVAFSIYTEVGTDFIVKAPVQAYTKFRDVGDELDDLKGTVSYLNNTDFPMFKEKVFALEQDVREIKENKVTEITEESTDDQYPTAKAVYDFVESGSGGSSAPSENGVSGVGLSSNAITLLIQILQEGIYSTNISGKIEQLQTALAQGGSGGNSGGSDIPTTSDDITVTDGIMTIVSVGSEVNVTDNIMTIL